MFFGCLALRSSSQSTSKFHRILIPLRFPFSWQLMLIKSRKCLDTGAHVRRHFALCVTLTGHRWWTTSRCRDGLNNLCFFCVRVDGENKNYFLLISKFASRYSMAEVRQKVTRNKKKNVYKFVGRFCSHETENFRFIIIVRFDSVICGTWVKPIFTRNNSGNSKQNNT